MTPTESDHRGAGTRYEPHRTGYPPTTAERLAELEPLEPPDYADEHAGGQLRLGAAGDQLGLLPLPDELIPSTPAPAAAGLELAAARAAYETADRALARTPDTIGNRDRVRRLEAELAAAGRRLAELEPAPAPGRPAIAGELELELAPEENR